MTSAKRKPGAKKVQATKVAKKAPSAPGEFDPSWTFDEAMAAGEKWGDPHSMRSPFFRWYGFRQLEELKKRFAAGERFAMMTAIDECATHALEIPDWVAREYFAAYDKINSATEGSWDKVFPLPYVGRQLAAVRKEKENKFPVVKRVHDLRGLGERMDAALFEKVGKEFGVNKTQVSNWYYAVMSNFKPLKIPRKKRLISKK